MQSTLNLSGAPPVAARPKIGRPPALPPVVVPFAAPEPIVINAPPGVRAWSLSQKYYIFVALGLVTLAVLVASLKPWLFDRKQEAPLPELAAVSGPLVFRAEGPEGTLIGSFTRIDEKHKEPVVSAPSSTGAIDNKDRERLLSILSKD